MQFYKNGVQLHLYIITNAGGLFVSSLKIPMDFPHAPPQMAFTGRAIPYHPNVREII